MKIITRAVMQWDESLSRYVTVEEDSYEYTGPVALCKKPKAPAAPDPNVVAAAQTNQNRDTALFNAGLNRINQSGPQGSISYSTSGIDPTTGAPIYNQTTSLDPQLQRVWERATSSAQQPFSYTSATDARNKTESALYDRNAAYLDPQYQRGEESMRTRLANQGVVEGSEAYTNAYDDFSRQKEMAYRQARNEAVAGGGAESDRALNQESFIRGVPASEYAALMSAGTPNFSGAPQVSTNPADISGAMSQQYQGQMDAYNAKMNQRNSLLQGAASVGGAFLLSDERAKDNIEPIGELNDGTGLFSYTYKGSETPQVGVMAQEVEKQNPAAVRQRPDGLKEVNYRRVLARALAA